MIANDNRRSSFIILLLNACAKYGRKINEKRVNIYV